MRVMEGVIERRRSWVVFCGLSICEGELAAGGGGGGGRTNRRNKRTIAPERRGEIMASACL